MCTKLEMTGEQIYVGAFCNQGGGTSDLAVGGCLFDVFTAALHMWRRISPSVDAT
jgi:hypothetical protein